MNKCDALHHLLYFHKEIVLGSKVEDIEASCFESKYRHFFYA
jgi:hypothetical protein